MSEFDALLTLGTIESPGDSPAFKVTEELLKTHLGIFGGTRQGKSKLLELICRELALNRRGFAFIDPHSDTADDLLAFFASHAREYPLISHKVHYLKPGDRLFSFDPFLYRPDPDESAEDAEFAYKCWLHTKIRDMSKIIVRQQGETEDEAQKTVRLRRWLYNGLYAVGVRQDSSGTHLPLKDIFILLNPSHPQHAAKYNLVAPYLSDLVRADFEKLRKIKDPRKQEDWVESTFNRLREMFSPVVERIFNMEAPSIDFYEIIARGDILLASLGKTNYFHEDDGMAIAGLLIRQLSEAIRTVDREDRTQFYLFIDEAHNYLGDDLIRLMKESGKYKLSFGLAVQGLDNLQKGQIDMVPAVLGQCGVRITFRQQFHEHAEILAKSLCYTMLDFTELMLEVERDDGYEWIITKSLGFNEGHGTTLQYGESESVTDSWGESEGRGFAKGTSESRSISDTEGLSTSLGESHTLGKSESEQRSVSDGSSRSLSASEGVSQQVSRGKSTTEGHTTGTNNMESETEQRSHTDGSSGSRGVGHNQSEGRSMRPSSDGHSITENRNDSRTESRTAGNSSADSESRGTTIGRSSQESDSVSTGRNQSVSFGMNESLSASASFSQQKGQSLGQSQSETDGTSKSVAKSISHANSSMIGSSLSESLNWSKSIGRAIGRATSRTEGTSETRSRSISFQETPLHKVRVVQQRTGRLEVSVPDQFAKFTNIISNLQKQHCMVAIAAFNSAFVLRIDNVRPAFEATFESKKFQNLLIAKFKEEIFATNAYYFKASDGKKLEVVTTQPNDDLEKNTPFGG